MSRRLRMLLGVLAGLAAGQAAWAQQPGTVRPPYSPYLNLLRPGASVTQNYYGMVRPEVDFRNSIGGLQNQYSNLSYSVASGQTAQGVPQTGHPTSFFNYSHYYRGRAGGGSIGGGGFGGGRPVAQQAPPTIGRGGSQPVNPGAVRGGASGTVGSNR